MTTSELRERYKKMPVDEWGYERIAISLEGLFWDAVRYAERLEETLAWYEEHVFNARRVSPEGETARKVLDDDGGKKARIALGGENDDK